MSDKLKLVDWITEVAGEYIEPWVAGVIAESWQDDKNRLRELESGLDDAIEINNAHIGREEVYLKRIRELEDENADLRQVAHRHDEEMPQRRPPPYRAPR